MVDLEFRHHAAPIPRSVSSVVPTILIADNDVAVRALLAEVLARAGMEVVHATDGEQARDKARLPGLAAIVCDLDMPRVSGIEVLESMADLPIVPPAVVISGYLDEAIADRLAKLAWVRDVLRKPFDLLAFSRRVCELATAPCGAAATSAF
jgi:CheY-like chemotaxis protein